MAVITDSPVTANILGTLGAIFWSIQLLPQIWKNYRKHSTEGFQPSFMLLWALAGIPLGIFNIVDDLNIPLWIQPQILSVLSLITWGQCYYYGHKWSLKLCILAVVGFAILLGGVETAGILSFRLIVTKENGVNWPLYLMASLATLLLSLGVLREYLQIYRHRSTAGISILFIILDALGDLTSLLSILFETKPFIFGIIAYATELTLWIGIIIYYSIEHLYGNIINNRNHVNNSKTDLQLPAPDRTNTLAVCF
ncbi:unnamed protein product [Adineta steineri]|uniref:Uncharacterized protein n=1 Tax=Adineta steineri TaxID=433720 RepID=A0A815R5A6_9BILA|nr:unnamed protein product [Adineta steineri]